MEISLTQVDIPFTVKRLAYKPSTNIATEINGDYLV